jgi:hypothetical protein
VLIDAGGRSQRVTTDPSGIYVVSNVPPGNVSITGELAGFKRTRRSLRFGGEGQQVDLTLNVGGVEETVTVSADSPSVQFSRAENVEPSLNVQNLQRRASGVLPIRMDVPRAGTSHRFVKPLVIDEESVVTFRYKRQ